MNFYDGKMVQDNGNLAVDLGSFRVRVSSKRTDAVLPYVDKSVVMGLRPEDIHDPDYTLPGIETQTVSARVEVTELMGNEVFLYLNTGGVDYVARVEPRTSARVGNEVQVTLDVDNLHLFDADSELAIR